nr:MAG TPA: hypothetical protein [Caudoviricetes sp.]
MASQNAQKRHIPPAPSLRIQPKLPVIPQPDNKNSNPPQTRELSPT